MRELLASGRLGGRGGAAGAARSQPPRPRQPDRESAVELREALERFDDAAAHAAFDRLLADFSLDAVLEGRRPARCCASSATAGSEARSRSRRSTSPRTSSAAACSDSRAAGTAAPGRARVLACPPGERHDLGLSPSGSRCASTAGGSRSSAPTRRSTRCGDRERLAPEARRARGRPIAARLEAVAAELASLGGDDPVWARRGRRDSTTRRAAAPACSTRRPSRRPPRRVRACLGLAASRSSTVSRRRISRASPSATSTAAGRGTPL